MATGHELNPLYHGPLATFRRKIEVVGVVVNSARQGKTRRG
jgi:hypothetical protein